MKTRTISSLCLVPFLMGSIGLFAGCEPKGPAEKAGENIDQAVDNAKETVNPSGPLQKAGENVDRALGK